MKTIQCALLLVTAVLAGAESVHAQNTSTLEAVAQRLDQLERQNAELREQLGLLREELDRVKQSAPEDVPSNVARIDVLEEKVDLNDSRISEQDQIKTQSSLRVPVRLTGTILFSMFRNSPAGVLAAQDYPVAARTDSAPAAWAASLRRSIIGAVFQTPEAVLGGQFRGAFFTDLTEAGDAVTNIQPRLRTATIEGQWPNGFAFLTGQDRPIFAPREPTSLVQVQFAPLNGAGNFWLWRPQLRLQQTFSLGLRREFRARIGVSQATETGGALPPESRATIEPRRPALEGHFQFAYRIDDGRGVEVGSGFHRSTTHVLHASVPADVISLDWLVRPIRWVEFTGTVYTGENMTKGGSAAFTQGHALIPLGPGVFRAVPVARHGGWSQVTFLPTPRLTVNLQAGVDDPKDDYLLPTSLTKNTALVFNFFYRLAPNVFWGYELGHMRTDFKAGQHPSFNHHDVHVAYLF